jgi:regulator of protease activity HflC (stomatin/prohibitin superfamily)
MNIQSLIQGIAVIIWLLAVGVLVLVIVQAWRGKPIKRGVAIVIGAFVLALIVTTLSAGLVFINPQERGVVISALTPTGYRQTILSPGLHFIVPFAESVIRYPISRQTYTMSAASSEGQKEGDDSIYCRTKDGQEVSIDASVIYEIDPTQVIQVHIAWQNRYSDELVRPEVRGIIRDVVAQYDVEEVVSAKRLEMTQQMSDQIKAKFADNGLVMVDYILRNITFSTEYAASVEQKQIAQQQALQAEYVVQQKKYEAQQAVETAKGQAQATIEVANGNAQARVIEATAEAQALQLIADVLKNNPDLLTYQYITKLSPNVEVMFLPSDSPFLFTIPSNLLPVQ